MLEKTLGIIEKKNNKLNYASNKQIPTFKYIRSSLGLFVLITVFTWNPLKMFSQWKLNQYPANRKRRTLPKYPKLWINKLHFGSNVAEEMKMFSLTRNKGWRYEYSEEVPGNHAKLSYPFAATLLSLTKRNSCHPFIVLSASLKCGHRNENFALQKSHQTDLIYHSLTIHCSSNVALQVLI